VGENHRYHHVCLISYYVKKIFITSCTSAESYQYAGTHLQEDITSTRSPTPTGRKLQPPNRLYQILLEGRSYPLIEGCNPQHLVEKISECFTLDPPIKQ